MNQKQQTILAFGIADWKGLKGMDNLEKMKAFWLAPIETEFAYNEQRDHINDIAWLISEIETLRLDNTYLQQRLQMEVEKKNENGS